MTTSTAVNRKDVSIFTSECVLLRSRYIHFRILFETGDDRKELLSLVAPIFFGDIYATLRDTIIGNVCRLTDPEESRGDKNLTVKFLVNNSDFSGDPKTAKRVGKLNEQLHVMRQRLVPARHKRIAHFDRLAAHSRVNLGKATPRQWEQFWLDLAEFVAIFNARYVSKTIPFQLDDIGLISDADSLIKALQESTYFHEFAADPKLSTRCLDVALSSKYSNA